MINIESIGQELGPLLEMVMAFIQSPLSNSTIILLILLLLIIG